MSYTNTRDIWIRVDRWGWCEWETQAVSEIRSRTTSCHVVKDPNSDRESCIAQAHRLREVYDGAELHTERCWNSVDREKIVTVLVVGRDLFGFVLVRPRN